MLKKTLLLCSVFMLVAIMACAGGNNEQSESAPEIVQAETTQPAETQEPASEEAVAEEPATEQVDVLEQVIACYETGANAMDIDAYMSCFAEGAEIMDLSRLISGRGNIRTWALNEVIPYGDTFAHRQVLERSEGFALTEVNWRPWVVHYSYWWNNEGLITRMSLQYAN